MDTSQHIQDEIVNAVYDPEEELASVVNMNPTGVNAEFEKPAWFHCIDTNFLCL